MNPKDILNDFLLENPGYVVKWQGNQRTGDLIVRVEKDDIFAVIVISLMEFVMDSDLEFADCIFKALQKGKEDILKQMLGKED